MEVVSGGFKVGDAAKVKANGVYVNGDPIPNWVKNSTVYIRGIRDNGDIVFSVVKTGAVTGVTTPSSLTPYTETAQELANEIKVGSIVSLADNATYADGSSIPNWVIKSKLYAREILGNGNVIISTQKTGAITGVVNKKYLSVGSALPKVKVVVDVLNVRESASTSSTVVDQIRKGTTHTVLETNGKWGHIDKGWIYLPYTQKV